MSYNENERGEIVEKHRAIPQGYMTVGALAKKMNTTVRTLQYYDKEGILSPSTESEGGRRLYTDKDIIRLHQIQSMKYLGFTLDDIKTRLVSLDTPEEVAAVLAQQVEAVQEKISTLSDVLQAIEALRTETLQMKMVDFSKYADIIINLQMKNEFYGLIKHFDNKTLDRLRSRFTVESGQAITATMSQLFEKIAEYQENKILPESEQGIALAKTWWDMVTEFTGGDMSLLPELMKIAENKDNAQWNEKWSTIEPFITKAMESYFTNLGVDPFKGVEP